MNFLYLLLTSALPVVKVCLLSLVGVALAHLGVLDVKGRNSLSRVIFYVFIPSLTFTKLAASVDLANMGRWWFLPVNVLLSITVGMGIGWICALVLKAPKRLRPHVICSVATGNVGNLPLVLVAALCEDSSSPIANEVAPGKCTELGIAYVVFAMWVAGLFQFTFGYFLLKPSAEDKAAKLPTVRQDQHGYSNVNSEVHDIADCNVLELQPLHSSEGVSSDGGDPELSIQSMQSPSSPDGEPDQMHEVSCQERQQRSLLASTRDSSSSLTADAGFPSKAWQHGSWPGGSHAIAHYTAVQQTDRGDRPRREQTEGSASFLERGWATLAALPWSQMLNLPVLSAFAGLAVGCTPFLKGLLFGPAAPFGFVKDSLEVLGAPMIPCMMMVLGAVLYKGPGTASVAPRLIIGVAFVRLLLIPLLGTSLVLGLRRAGVFTPPNSLFTLVLLLGHSTPTAINVQTLATLHQNGEQAVSAMLFWQYMGAVFTLPLLLTFFFHVI
ncbi:g2384 [Coccomyxa elongata]